MPMGLARCNGLNLRGASSSAPSSLRAYRSHGSPCAARSPRCQSWWRSSSGMRPLDPESELLLCCARTRPDDGTAQRIRALVFQPLDWDWLLRTPRPPGMLPLLHRHLSASPENIPAPVLAALSDGFQVGTRQSLRLVGEMLRLLGRFAERRVVAVPYKGPPLAARCYGALPLRPFRDLDFLVRPQNLAPARQVLAADGYAPSPPRTPRQEAAIHTTWREDAFWRDADVVELHWAFAPREFPLPLKVEDVWARLEPLPIGGTLVSTMSAEHLLLVLCAHGAKHCWERLGWICDVAELLRRTPALDLSGMLAQARSLGVERIVLLGLRLAAELLDVPLPGEGACPARGDPAVGALARQVRATLFRRMPTGSSHSWESRLFHLRTRERWRDRLRYCARVALTPTPGDWAWLRLPDALYALYYVTRPIRLIAKGDRKSV